MEGEGASVPITVVSPTNDPDFSPLGSPDTTDPNLHGQFPQKSTEAEATSSVLSDERRHKIIKQVEFYFSDENLPTDKFLMSHVTKDKDGFVPIGVVASFRKMKKLTTDLSLIVDALRESSLLVVSSDGKKVKRLNPLSFTDARDPQLCTILVENLPEDNSRVNIWRIFGEAGNIKDVYIHDPNSARESRKYTMAEKLLSGKLYAIVEYETVEAAEKAVATLNNEQDWRYGMRVKLLKRKEQHGQTKKNRKDVDAQKSNNAQPSDSVGNEENHNFNEHHDDTHDEEDDEHLLKEKNAHKGRNRGRGRKQKYGGNANGQGHGSVSLSHHVEPSKPPPGPKMPDGTRGFAMGRGKRPVSNQS